MTAVFACVWSPRPLPDIFLLAAEKAGVAPSACVVVEDSTSGVRAAQAADMEVVGYLGGGHAQADWYREKLASFDIPLTYSDDELLAYLAKPKAEAAAAQGELVGAGVPPDGFEWGQVY